jgi:4,5-DOPA dioxygenase extradiol
VATAHVTPALFVSHGAPMIAIDPGAFGAHLRAFASSAPRPRAIVIMSAHWETPGGVRVTTSAHPETIHDFGGFPDALYRLRYAAPGDPKLAGDILARLTAANIAARADAQRGFDHGAWVPLMLAYPEADVPVVCVSLPVPRAPSDVLAIGRALAPLREEGVMIIGSGGIVHNLRTVMLSGSGSGDGASPEPWATAFDEWVHANVIAKNDAALAAYRANAPSAALAVPESEHFDPLFFTLGARAASDRVQEVHRAIMYGTLSMQSFALIA